MGIHTNQHKTVASLKLALFYDLLNKLHYSASFHPKQTADLRCIEDKIKDLPPKTLTVYDRGFGSILLLFLHSFYKSKCLIRVKKDFSNYVKKFIESTDNELVIEVDLGSKCVAELKKMGINRYAKDTQKVRLIKVVLSTGEVEILMTNMDSDELSIAEAESLYGMRWGIETGFNYMKNVFKLGIFSGYSERVIYQDLWCNLIAENMINILIFSQEEALKKINKKRKKAYKINKAVAAGTVLSEMKTLFLCDEKELQKRLENLFLLVLKSLEKVKSTNKERQRKRQRPNDRHTTEKNYKHNF
jgi:hypothetical protein